MNNISPAPPHIFQEPFFQHKEPHHFRFTETDEGPVLRLHADDDGRYLEAFIALEYPLGPDRFTRLPMPLEERAKVVRCFEIEGEKPF
jgi:hypothetical protein